MARFSELVDVFVSDWHVVARKRVALIDTSRPSQLVRLTSTADYNNKELLTGIKALISSEPTHSPTYIDTRLSMPP